MPEGLPGSRRTRIDIVGEINTSISYANFAKVQVTPFEAIVTFARVDPATATGQVPGGTDVAETVDAPAVARIALPHKVLAALAKAIREQLSKHPELGASPEET
jgi:hypothetical protein